MPPIPSLPAEDREPRRKALLIGIKYDSSGEQESPESGALIGPHCDVANFKQFIMEFYHYCETDIIIMQDDPLTPTHLQPSRRNLLHQFKALVEGAQEGDRFVLYYSGHSRQVENTTGSEEDDMDEALVPCDDTGHDEIRDNVLKQLLVDPLPVGCTLTAIFDTCHSGTMLDLDHVHCHNVYVPYIYKGERDASLIRNANARKLARFSSGRIISSQRRNAEEVESRKGSFQGLPATSIKAKQLQWRNTMQIFPSHFAVPPILPEPVENTAPTRAWTDPGTPSNIGTTFEGMDVVSPTSPDFCITPPSGIFPGRLTVADPNSDLPVPLLSPYIAQQPSWLLQDEAQRCMSPISEHFKCDGWCTPESGENKPRVVALAAAGDNHLTWDLAEGGTLTIALIDILKTKPEMPFDKLMTELSYRLYEMAQRVHQWSRDQYKKRKAPGTRVKHDDIELNMIPTPQLSSNIRLNMSDRLIL
ncbi:hypothetical protein PUNSTDRAFT_134614 [Punctularia strigosozonata HHB-11173 SS5]|uniref:uncharacterized protein n=1 Tax=Punctularia strigosozonata (strain HHB-11173) TaxID=741275 RepID=UPI0004416B29|nr:uncharacterized protein PUNSTDRAFT_134614 [Punctularia strigosozonata HHB-11173 SS5]EIN08223.1 hypothetical protein PUNSTDRAFT_134614 [Punctularia strigosozonata HHB-11173 SS5]